MPISLHSSKPACGPSVTPVPRSTRKLNCAYGRSRSTDISGSFVLFREPNEPVVRELELLDRDLVRNGVERRPRPAARPRSFEAPGVDDPATGGIELLDRDRAPVVAPLHDLHAPVVELRRLAQRAPQDDGSRIRAPVRPPQASSRSRRRAGSPPKSRAHADRSGRG